MSGIAALTILEIQLGISIASRCVDEHEAALTSMGSLSVQAYIDTY